MANVRTLTVGGVTYNLQDTISGYITGITSSDVTTALGFTPYNSTNPNGYTTNTGTITSVKTTAGAHTTINVTSGAANFNVPTKTSHLTNDSGFLTSFTETDPVFVASAAYGITSSDITSWNNKLDSYTETDPTVPSWAKSSSKPSYALTEITGASDVQAIEALTGTSGFLKKTAANTWALDTNTYLTSYTETDPVFIASAAYGITSSDITNWNSKTSNTGTITEVKTAAGTHTAIDVTSGKAEFNVPTKTSHLTNDSGFLTSYTETDPVFSASAAASITSTDISNWNSIVSDDKTWNGVSLAKQQTLNSGDDTYVPLATSTSPINMSFTPVKKTPTANAIAKYDANSYLYSTTPAVSDDSTKVATTAFVQDAIEGLPTPMQFIGTVGTSGTTTWANLPTASGHTGYTYKVITDHAAETGKPAAKTGDTIISNGIDWIVIPSGDEPSGTVTSVTLIAGGGISLDTDNTAITSSGSRTISHADTSSQASVTASNRTYIKSVTLDTYGHVTGLSTGTETVTDTNTTYSLSNALSSHKFTETLTAGGSGSGTSTATMEFVAGTGISLTDDTTNKKITIASTVTVPTSAASATTGVTISDHSTTTIYGVKSGTSSTTTASKASGANGTAPTLGTAISIYGVKSGTNSTTTASKVTVGSSSTDYGVTAAGSGSFTQGSFNGGSFSATVTNHVLSYSFTAATHGADSHTHTAPTLGSKVPTVSASDVTVPIRADSATSIPNVTDVGSASTWSFTDVTVPIRADSSTTVVTSKTHTVNDSGHTHTLS